MENNEISGTYGLGKGIVAVVLGFCGVILGSMACSLSPLAMLGAGIAAPIILSVIAMGCSIAGVILGPQAIRAFKYAKRHGRKPVGTLVCGIAGIACGVSGIILSLVGIILGAVFGTVLHDDVNKYLY